MYFILVSKVYLYLKILNIIWKLKTYRFDFIFFFINCRYSNRTKFSHIFCMFCYNYFFWLFNSNLIVYICHWTFTRTFNYCTFYNKYNICCLIMFVIKKKTTSVKIYICICIEINIITCKNNIYNIYKISKY